MGPFSDKAGKMQMTNKEIIVKITNEEFLRMQAVRLDNDAQDALEIVKVLVERIEADEHKGMKSHLDT